MIRFYQIWIFRLHFSTLGIFSLYLLGGIIYLAAGGMQTNDLQACADCLQMAAGMSGR